MPGVSGGGAGLPTTDCQAAILDAEIQISELSDRLSDAKLRLAALWTAGPGIVPAVGPSPPSDTPLHFLLLLADSALPLGSFAFSSGLESYMAHTSSPCFAAFLPTSVSSFASSYLPFALAAYRVPASLPVLDEQLDTQLVCIAGRRASVAQGRALLALWQRSLAPAAGSEASDALAGLGLLVKSHSDRDGLPCASAHLAPLFGAVACALGLSARQTAFVLVLGHAKAVVSAAVRAGLLGSYQAQRILASEGLRTALTAAVDRDWLTPVEATGQRVPIMDLWAGRHELLYSRIFNS